MENVIFTGLLNDRDYANKVVPFLKEEYFTERKDKLVFDIINKHLAKYNVLPSKEEIVIELNERRDIPAAVYSETVDSINLLKDKSEYDTTWLIDKTEKFCKDRALYNALNEAISIADGMDLKKDLGIIPQLMTSALAVTFDTSIGLEYSESIDDMLEFYNRDVAKISTGLEYVDRILRGGIRKKTLTVFMATTGGGKTIMMCHLAAQMQMAGKNVLYISAEMAQEMITQRIDANLMDIEIDALEKMDRQIYAAKKQGVLKKATGRLIVKEYPTATVNSNHIRSLLNDLRLKKNFVPDVVFVDYLNICASSRLKSSDAGSHTYPKAIAEEIRSLAVELDFAAVTATQANRSGYNNSDMDLTNTSESMGLPVTADVFLSLISTTEMEALNQIVVKQLKNRFGDINNPKSFVLGLDRPKMRFYDLEESAQRDLISREEPNQTAKPSAASTKNKFGDFT